MRMNVKLLCQEIVMQKKLSTVIRNRLKQAVNIFFSEELCCIIIILTQGYFLSMVFSVDTDWFVSTVNLLNMCGVYKDLTYYFINILLAFQTGILRTQQQTKRISLIL